MNDANQPTSTHFDKLSDTLDKKTFDWNLKVLAFVTVLLLKPLALATEPFFRKNFGERYLSTGALIGAQLLWFLSQALNALLQFLVSYSFSELGWVKLAAWIHDHKISTKVTFIASSLFFFFAGRAYLAIYNRRLRGIRWYSLSRGESVFGSENETRDKVIGAVVGGLLLVFAPALGILFILSRFVSHYLTSRQQLSIYNLYLDRMDLEIQNEHLQPALSGEKTVAQAQGLHAPLPAQVKGPHQKSVARVIARTPSGSQPQPVTASRKSTSKHSVDQDTDEEQPAAAVPSPQGAKGSWIIVTVLAVAWAGFAFLKPDKEKTDRPLLRQAHYQPLPQPEFITPIEPLIQTPAPSSPQTRRTATLRDPVSPAGRNDAKAPTTADSAQTPAPQAPKSEREELLEKMKSMLATESQTFSNFQAQCESLLQGNSERIQYIRSRKASFSEKNEQVRRMFQAAVQGQKDLVPGFEKSLTLAGSVPEAELRKSISILTAAIQANDATRSTVVGALNGLRKEIVNAPKVRNALYFGD